MIAYRVRRVGDDSAGTGVEADDTSGIPLVIVMLISTKPHLDTAVSKVVEQFVQLIRSFGPLPVNAHFDPSAPHSDIRLRHEGNPTQVPCGHRNTTAVLRPKFSKGACHLGIRCRGHKEGFGGCAPFAVHRSVVLVIRRQRGPKGVELQGRREGDGPGFGIHLKLYRSSRGVSGQKDSSKEEGCTLPWNPRIDLPPQ